MTVYRVCLCRVLVGVVLCFELLCRSVICCCDCVVCCCLCYAQFVVLCVCVVFVVVFVCVVVVRAPRVFVLRRVFPLCCFVWCVASVVLGCV